MYVYSSDSFYCTEAFWEYDKFPVVSAVGAIVFVLSGECNLLYNVSVVKNIFHKIQV